MWGRAFALAAGLLPGLTNFCFPPVAQARQQSRPTFTERQNKCAISTYKPQALRTSARAACAPAFIQATSFTQKNRSTPVSIQKRASDAGAAADVCFPCALAARITRAA